MDHIRFLRHHRKDHRMHPMRRVLDLELCHTQYPILNRKHFLIQKMKMRELVHDRLYAVVVVTCEDNTLFVRAKPFTKDYGFTYPLGVILINMIGCHWKT